MPTLVQRVQGSPDLLDAPVAQRSTSCSATTGSRSPTMFLRTTDKHNEANGQADAYGTWPPGTVSRNCGWEGDDDAPSEVLALRRRQLRNAVALAAELLPQWGADGGAWAMSSAAPSGWQQRLQPGHN